MLRTSYICLLKEGTQPHYGQCLREPDAVNSRNIQGNPSAIKDNIIGSLIWLSHWATSYESYFTGTELENTLTASYLFLSSMERLRLKRQDKVTTQRRQLEMSLGESVECTYFRLSTSLAVDCSEGNCVSLQISGGPCCALRGRPPSLAPGGRYTPPVCTGSGVSVTR